jgi:Zn-dependent protease with chaperone function
LAVGYNWRKFGKERYAFISSLVEAQEGSHREMILSHHFYIFIFESFISLIVANIISEGSFELGILGLGVLYLALLVAGFFFYQNFLKFLEKDTGLILRQSFNRHLIKELRVSFAVIMMPILIYSIINWAFLDEVYNDWGSLWFIGLFFNIIFVSVLTIVCTVIIMLRLIPNREITEPEYRDIINRRLEQINMPHMRVRWIESDMKNAFIVGLKLLKFSNQTMFVGKSLRSVLSKEEFDAVIAHELAHVANRHVHKRIIDLLKNLLSILMGLGVIMLISMGLSVLYWGEDVTLHSSASASFMIAGLVGWVMFNYALLFDTIRSHEYEADAYAVLNLGASSTALMSALEKLTSSQEMPQYLQMRTKKTSQKNFFTVWLGKTFSTHPSLPERRQSLEHKIASNLPFNHYFSTTQKIRTTLAGFLRWKISIPAVTALIVFCSYNVYRYHEGQKLVGMVQDQSHEQIMRNPFIKERINSKPMLLGSSLMSYIVKKHDEELINHFLAAGAEKGRTLVYIAELKDYELFQKYYQLHQDSLTDDEYFLILRKTATMNFTEGYRLLVNAKRFEELSPDFKADLAQIKQSDKTERRPASVKP